MVTLIQRERTGRLMQSIIGQEKAVVEELERLQQGRLALVAKHGELSSELSVLGSSREDSPSAARLARALEALRAAQSEVAGARQAIKAERETGKPAESTRAEYTRLIGELTTVKLNIANLTEKRKSLRSAARTVSAWSLAQGGGTEVDEQLIEEMEKRMVPPAPPAPAAADQEEGGAIVEARYLADEEGSTDR